MGTWGGEEGPERGFIQKKQPPRRILPRKPKGGGQEGSPLSVARDGSLRGHHSPERRQRAVRGCVCPPVRVWGACAPPVCVGCVCPPCVALLGLWPYHPDLLG